MRQHLYRGKRIDNGKWIYGDLLTPTDIMDIWEISEKTGMGNRYEIDPETIGEWTGHKDLIGRKIFEGDIIKFLFKDDQCFEVVWDKVTASFYFYNVNKRHGFCCVARDIEIVGNIHDNTELLNK